MRAVVDSGSINGNIQKFKIYENYIPLKRHEVKWEFVGPTGDWGSICR